MKFAYYINKFAYNIIGKFTEKNLHTPNSSNTREWKESGFAVNTYKKLLSKEFRPGRIIGSNFSAGYYKSLFSKELRPGGAIGSNLSTGYYKSLFSKELRPGGATGSNLSAGYYKSLFSKELRPGGVIGSNLSTGYYKNLFPKGSRPGGVIGSNLSTGYYKNLFPKGSRPGGVIGSNLSAGYYKSLFSKELRPGGVIGSNLSAGYYKSLFSKELRPGGVIGSNLSTGYYKSLFPKGSRPGGVIGSNLSAGYYKSLFSKELRPGGVIGSNLSTGYYKNLFPRGLRHGSLAAYDDFLSSSSNGISKIIKQLSDSHKKIKFYNDNYKIPKNYLVSSQDKSLISEKRTQQVFEQLIRNRNLDFSNVSSDTISTALDTDYLGVDNVDNIYQAIKELSNSKNYVDIEEQAKKGDYSKNTQSKHNYSILITILRLILEFYIVPVIFTPIVQATDQTIENEVTKYNLLRTGAISPWGYVRCTNSLPVFSGHSLKSKILYHLPFKTKVKVIKQVGAWSHIKIKFGQKYSDYGWVKSKYLVID
ncbi:hypothetical protein UCCLB556_pA0005 (plasmid) [Levilactobacillus brevis]|nr:hypothetical protein UCCLB556_pA0005 [Levilactobacillus brevis]